MAPDQAARALPVNPAARLRSCSAFAPRSLAELITCPAARARLLRRGGKPGGVGRHVLRPLRRLLDVAGDFVRRRALLLHGRRDGGRDVVHRTDDAGDGLDGADGIRRRRLNGIDLRADASRRLGRLCRERLHLLRHDGKPLAGFPGPCGLDGRIQRQEIGLARDAADELDHGPDLGRRRGEIAHLLRRIRRAPRPPCAQRPPNSPPDVRSPARKPKARRQPEPRSGHWPRPARQRPRQQPIDQTISWPSPTCR